MNALFYRVSPAYFFLGAVSLGLGLALVAILVALAQPQVALPQGAVPLHIGTIELIETDRIEEPDQLSSYDAIRAFHTRQGAIRAELDSDAVKVIWRTPGGERATAILPVGPRHFSDLPFEFWFQIGVGTFSILIGGWVLGLRRADWGVRMFALTTLFLPFATHSAAIYSTRQIALDPALFHALSSINAFGAMSFGVALLGLFSQYPKPLFRPVWLLVPAAIFGTGILCTIAHIGPDNLIGVVILSEMLIATAFGVIQWVRSRREPLNRAGLRWFVLVSLVGCALFVMLSTAPYTLGLASEGVISQAYAFGFFNLMHIGLALGVLRYKVFNLDRWSYYIWLWISGMILIFVLDVALIRLLQAQPWVSLGVSLLVAGFLYFPLRQVLLKLLLQRRSATLSGRMAGIVGAALSPSQREHSARWDQLLSEIFEPLAPPEPLDATVAEPRIDENGLALLIPGVDGLAPRRLRYAQKGKRLFSPNDVEVASNLVQTHELAAEGRRAYERGVVLERDRISRDVHDNIGAQLMSALHSREVSRKDDLLRDSLHDLRAIINDGFRAESELAPLLADLRTEIAARLDVHGLAFIWRGPELVDTGPMVPFELVNGLRSILREAVSNILRHSQARTAVVSISLAGDTLGLIIEDDGIGLDESTQCQGGNGIPNIRDRADFLAGTSVLGQSDGMAGSATGRGTKIAVTLPLNPAQARQARVAG